jgi:3-oxoacyl-[acyl-carrier protein] reductase
VTFSLEIENKVALVTGAAQGIGFAIARDLAIAGADVVLADLNGEKASAGATTISDETGSNAIGITLDVSKKESIDSGMDNIRAAMGDPAILVNNAGLYRSTPILEAELETWQQLLDVMLTGPFLMSQAVIPDMIKKKWGRIINLGSIASVMGFGEDIGYCAAKSGIVGMTHALAAELAGHNICVNAICPGNIMTELMQDTGKAIEKRDGLESGQFLRERAAAIPLGRLGDPVDIAHLAAFLCSEQAGYVTGQSWHVNGGLYQT